MTPMKFLGFVLLLPLMLLDSCASGGGIWKSVAFSAPSSRWGVDIRMGYVAEGLYTEFFSIDFSPLLRNVSDGAIPLDVINLYTTATIDEEQGYSGFLDHRSPYKDSWFTVMLVRDTQAARQWLLSEPDNPRRLQVRGTGRLGDGGSGHHLFSEPKKHAWGDALDSL